MESVARLKILHISRTMNQGGAEKIVYQLAKGNKAKKAEVYVASSGGVYVSQLSKHEIPHLKIFDLECKKPQIVAKNLWALAKLVRKKKIEVIHTHHRMAACYAVILKIFFPKVHLVYTAHNVFYDKKKLTKLSLTKTNIIAVGNHVKMNLMQEFHIPEERIDVIYNSVEIFENQEMHLNPKLSSLKQQGYVLLGAIGRLSEQKGMDVFVNAFSKIKKEHSKVKAVIIGDGEQREELQNLICERGLEKDVFILGYQEHVTSLISQLDLVVMPSRWEGFPLTPIEVFAMKKTIVASDIGGINEIVKDHENGLLVAADDVEAFVAAIQKLMREETFKNRLEENARKYYEENFAYLIFVEKYNLFYQKMIELR